MRLIDADERIETIRAAYCKECNNYGGVKCRACRWDDAMGVIEDAPTVGAVEVVRCKDCANSYKSSSSSTGMRCKKWGYYDTDCDCCPDDYCSYGERKTNNFT